MCFGYLYGIPGTSLLPPPYQTLDLWHMTIYLICIVYGQEPGAKKSVKDIGVCGRTYYTYACREFS